MYTVRVLKGLRNNFVYYLNNKGISASVHFDPPLHQQKIYSKYRRGNLKSTNILSKQIATLPIYPDMKKKEIEYIIKTVSKWYRKNK
jgi:dTDP-4-amino-4,6-dideoxygalactose transaminase